MDINVERAKDAGVEIANDIQLCRGIMVVCIPQTLTSLEKQYRVMIQAKAEDRANLESINSM
jgi:HAE1 family hydrophobic/amphiphilic exporter-1